VRLPLMQQMMLAERDQEGHRGAAQDLSGG
jgi:hypothetical protein